jgi:hypothetical protein
MPSRREGTRPATHSPPRHCDSRAETQTSHSTRGGGGRRQHTKGRRAHTARALVSVVNTRWQCGHVSIFFLQPAAASQRSTMLWAVRESSKLHDSDSDGVDGGAPRDDATDGGLSVKVDDVTVCCSTSSSVTLATPPRTPQHRAARSPATAHAASRHLGKMQARNEGRYNRKGTTNNITHW